MYHYAYYVVLWLTAHKLHKHTECKYYQVQLKLLFTVAKKKYAVGLNDETISQLNQDYYSGSKTNNGCMICSLQ